MLPGLTHPSPTRRSSDRGDRRSIGDGDSTATTWREWAFVPMRFEGTVRHQMAQSVRTSFQGRHAVLPYVDDKTQTENDPLEVTAMRMLKRQLPNIIAEATSKQYSSYKRADKKIRSEERRVGKECVIRVDLGGRRIIKKKKERVDQSMIQYKSNAC